MNPVINADIEQFVASFPFRDKIHGKRIMVTGATGLIGSTLIRCLVALKEKVQIIAPVRNLVKMQNVLQEVYDQIEGIECDLDTYDFHDIRQVDYVFHCAAPTASSFFVSYPVETVHTIYNVTDQLLRYAHARQVSGIVFLSSLEVYGSGLNDVIVTEDMQGYWDTQDVRSSYPVAKRAAENLCHLYAKEYNLPVKIARLTQTTGAGINKEDKRVINQFARMASMHQDILLHTTGESARPYCYTIDCISALMYILFNGENGQAYNVANSATYISARDLAEFIRTHFAPQIHIIVDIKENMGYAPVSKLNLSTAKLEALGWKPRYDLHAIIEKLILSFNQ